MDEFSLIERYFAGLGAGPAVALSVGDDCALLTPPPGELLATSVDTLVCGVHFPAAAAPADIAYRAVAAAASDLAAMGARPLGMTLALTLPEADAAFLGPFAQGLRAAVKDFNLPLVGGDTTRGPLTVTVQVQGAVPAGAALTRAGAQPGDRLCVSGPLGDAAAALAFFQGEWQAPERFAALLHQRFYRPLPRLDLGVALRGVASAAIDISDGLLADAGHLARASGVRIDIESGAVPLSDALLAQPDEHTRLRWALAGGDDYELCFTLPAGAAVPDGCTAIGCVSPGEGVHASDTVDFPAGYTHFAS
ncbi:MAG: thiamine-phosphate kinase [Halioglobus sp.]|nr:thiamine-phosphate kinase [Halioglobus sp.]